MSRTDELSGPKGGSAEIIDMAAEREKRELPLGSYHVRVDLYEKGCGGAILGMGDALEPHVLRAVSENLMLLAWHIQDGAHAITKEDGDNMLAVCRVFANGAVETKTRFVDTTAQARWLKRRFAEAAEGIEPNKGTKPS